ncbi:MAG: ABC transporter permease [Ruminococcus sp.]|nr:ABC transporter permease [Ruminococcus sp.]
MAQTYSKKINKASKAEWRNNSKFAIVILILVVLGTLFMMIEWQRSDGRLEETITNANGDTITSVTYERAEFENAFGIFFTFSAALLGVFSVFGLFKDMVSKQQADVQLSLPLDARQRYLSKLLALFKIHILPLLVSCVLVVIVGGIHTGMWSQSHELIRLFTVMLAEALFLDSVAIFCMTCCGAKAEGVYTSIITAGCITVTPILFSSSILDRFSGVYSGYDIEKGFTLFGGLSFYWFPDFGTALTDQRYGSDAWLYLTVNILISCLVIFLSYFIYRRRDGRHVGKPMVFTLFMKLFMFMGLFTLFTMFYSGGIFSFGLLIAAVVFVVIMIIVSRAKIKPRHILGWLLNYALALVIFIAVTAAAFFTGGFGRYKFRPDVEKMNSINADVTVHFRGEEYLDSRRVHIDNQLRDDKLKREVVQGIFDAMDEYDLLGHRDLDAFMETFDNNYYASYYNRLYDDPDATGINIDIYYRDKDDNYTSFECNFTLDNAQAQEFLEKVESLSRIVPADEGDEVYLAAW